MSDLTLALSALTGGAAGALDKIDGAGLGDGDAAVVVLGGGVYHYHLNATSGETENSPYIISPDTNAGTKRWVLVMPVGPMSHVRAKRSTALSLPDSTATTLIHNTEEYDLLAEYNATTGVFTAKYAGYYSIKACMQLEDSAWTTNLNTDLWVYKNSSIHTVMGRWIAQMTISSIYPVVNGATSLYLDASDTLEIKGRQSSGGSIDTNTNADLNWSSIDRII